MRAERSGGDHRSPLRLRGQGSVTRGAKPSVSASVAAYQLASLAIFLDSGLRRTALRALAAPFGAQPPGQSVLKATAGSVRAGALRPVRGEGAHVTGFWRYAERVGAALSVTHRYVPLCRVRT